MTKELKRKFVNTLSDRLASGKPLMQAVIGPRQVGKTTGILQFLKEYKGQYHYANADDIFIADRNWLLEQWQNALQKGDKTLLVIDEIQKINNWSEIVKNLWDQQKIKKTSLKLIISGSSSLSINKGMTESLAGRFELIKVGHWNFFESNSLNNMDLDTYLNFGGYPQSYHYINDYRRWFNYIKDAIVDKVVEKDILQYANVKNPSLFKQAFEIICCYPSQEISYRKILGQLQDKGNTDLVKHYIALFESAYLIKAIGKYNKREFKTKSSSPKIIIMAPCLYQIFKLGGDKKGFVFESTVGARLLTITDQLYYWREGDFEVDFVLVWQGKLLAIEVKSGRKKKAGGLEKFMQLNPSAMPIIISQDNYKLFIKDPLTFIENIT